MTKTLKYFLSITLMLLSCSAYSQNWKSGTNAAYLFDLSERLNSRYLEDQAKVKEYTLRQGIPSNARINGTLVSIRRILPSGIPEYYKSLNLEASRNVGTFNLRPLGSLMLNLTGKNMMIGIWDSGSTNVEHQEFGDRIEIKDNIPYDDHGTHVAGTILAAGINPAAKGMAYEASAFAYEFNNDDAEIAAEAADGLIISNHSYGLRTGWEVVSGGTGWQWFGDPSVSPLEDYRFGFYNDDSKTWDDIAFNAPYYLIVKSAGNDRTDVGDGSHAPDGPYDCIDPKGVAKNILTVGAVEHLSGDYTDPSDVVMSAFSSWGPTDDGRIKPEITAIGVDVFSTLAGGIDDYGFNSGTSMSAPNATGSLALLQEYYYKLTGGEYMLSSSLKGLIIHTAREAGTADGPDYEYGWGLLAVDLAANQITRDDGANFIFEERTLDENDSITYTITSDGTGPLTATICWTDPSGTPPPISLNPQNLMLVNDLDIKVYSSGNDSTYLPWVLDPANPEDAAVTGDNFRDNVEKIEIKNPVAGDYVVTIKHKGALRNDKQVVSVIISNNSLNFAPQKLFWIGNTGGNWNDPANWSTSSGGAPGSVLPGSLTPVIFDNNSFSQTNVTVTFSGIADCYSVNYYTTDTCKFQLNGNTLNIDGSVYIKNPATTFTSGTVRFNGTISKNNNIESGTSCFKGVSLMFISQNGSWNIFQDMETQAITIDHSSFIARNKTISTGLISATNDVGNTIDLNGTIIKDINIFSLTAGSTADMDRSSVVFSNENGITNKTLSGGGKSFNNIVINNANLTINDDNIFNGIDVNGQLTVSGNNTIDSLNLSINSELILHEGTSQTINQHFKAIGENLNLIPIRSDGSANASLFADNENIRFCFDYIDVTNISVSGATGFLSGSNSTINSNSTGWIELSCSEALFPSFDIEYPCAMGLTKFTDTSTGLPTSWSWDFGDLQYPETNNSTQQNPYHQFKFPGTYDIIYNVENDLFDLTITRSIQIEEYETGLSVPSITIDGTKLTSSVIAPNYQWYYDNIPIVNATNRVFSIEEPGNYRVEISDENCLFVSENVIVTDIDITSDQKNNYLTAYPVPVDLELNLDFGNYYTGDIVISVYNLLGEKVLERAALKTAFDFAISLDVAALNPGIYNILIQSGKDILSKKVLIE